MPASLPLPSSEICEFLSWDSKFFGLKIGRIACSRLSLEQVPAVFSWARDRRLDCLYFLADPEEESIRIAQDHGFRLIDLRVTLEASPRRPAKGLGDSRIRPARQRDVAALRAIAGGNHTDSRFYKDTHFPRALCDEMYRVWIEKSCRGHAQLVLVAELEKRVTGYLTCHLAGEEGRIGLVGVSAHVRGAGLGSALVSRAMAWFFEQGACRVSVVTQGSNSEAQRLYQRHGFLTQSIQLWYHLWFQKK